MTDRIEVDGAAGEGGGQVVRTSLALAMATGRPLEVRHVRAKRGRPGLLRQHLTALNAIAEVCGGRVEGAALGSSHFVLAPGPVKHGAYAFAIGSAGSAALVVQTLVTGLLGTPGESSLVVTGGTDNPAAPPSRFLCEVWAPRVRQLGAELDVRVPTRGFYPKGGGRLEVRLRVPAELRGFDVPQRGELAPGHAIATVSRLPAAVGERELAELGRHLRITTELEEIEHPIGPGNVLSLGWEHAAGAEVFTAFGQKGKPAEKVAQDVSAEAQRWLASGAPVGEHQADQLVLLLAIAGHGSFETTAPSMHTRTQLELIPRFLDVGLDLEEVGADRWRISVR